MGYFNIQLISALVLGSRCLLILCVVGEIWTFAMKEGVR